MTTVFLSLIKMSSQKQHGAPLTKIVICCLNLTKLFRKLTTNELFDTDYEPKCHG